MKCLVAEPAVVRQVAFESGQTVAPSVGATDCGAPIGSHTEWVTVSYRPEAIEDHVAAFAAQRSIATLAAEQQSFLDTLPADLEDVDLPDF